MTNNNNPFGKQLTYNPIPQTIHWEIVGREKAGKSSLIPMLAKKGIVAVVDADGRFKDSIPEESNNEFFQISNHQKDMIDPDTIAKILHDALPKVGDKTSMIVIDTLTKILDPIIMEIQSKARPTVYDYRKKANAMKTLRAALNEWDCETVWVYHLKEVFVKEKGDFVIREKKSLSDIEYSRLGADITVSLVVVVDDNGKRGVEVKEARRGRTGFTYWDESGTWTNVRENLEAAIWGGLTKVEQVELENDRDVVLTSPDQAVRWAWQYSQNHGEFFKDATHAKNAYDKLKAELIETEENLTATIMYVSWKENVFQRELIKLEEDN